MLPLEKASRVEKRDYALGSTLYHLPIPRAVRSQIVNKRYSMKKRLALAGTPSTDQPTAFVIECFNPQIDPLDLALIVRPLTGKTGMPYQKRLTIQGGFQCVRIDFAEIANAVNIADPLVIEISPSDSESEAQLYFGLMDFVKETEAARPKKKSASKVKCVVWDLDNTIWDGTLVEDGAARLTLKPGIKDILESLDQRGILQSVASKNNPEEALAVLKQFGIEEYFLYPEISWQPKSGALKRIANNLNIGLDTFLFVDDQPFERSEVESAAAGVTTVDARDYQAILDRPACQVPITAESRERRKMYRVEQIREKAASNFGDDYRAFLRDCQIRLAVSPLSDGNLERVHELTQRTNQMNFSGNRYDRSVLQEMMNSPWIDTYVLSCEDRFGTYGIVGFSIVDSREPRMTDLMFSCRIQGKRVEHAFVAWIVKRYISASGKDFHADYRKTPRNAPSGQVFEDLGMVSDTIREGVTLLVFPRAKAVCDDEIISIDAPELQISATDK
jgi:FkbH-like protein